MAAGRGIGSQPSSYCRTAVQLLKEVHGCPSVPPYNDDAVDRVAQEVDILVDEMRPVEGEDPSDPVVMTGMVVRQAAALRNRRCLLAYTEARTEKIEDLRWSLGPHLPADVGKVLSQPEQEYFDKYSEILDRYIQESVVDATQHLEPPASVYVRVRVLKTLGEIVLPSGSTVTLRTHDMRRMRRADADMLTQLGAVECLEDE